MVNSKAEFPLSWAAAGALQKGGLVMVRAPPTMRLPWRHQLHGIPTCWIKLLEGTVSSGRGRAVPSPAQCHPGHQRVPCILPHPAIEVIDLGVKGEDDRCEPNS